MELTVSIVEAVLHAGDALLGNVQIPQARAGSLIVGDHAAAGASCHPTPVHRTNSAIHESEEVEALQMMRARVLYFKRGSNTKESGSLNRI